MHRHLQQQQQDNKTARQQDNKRYIHTSLADNQLVHLGQGIERFLVKCGVKDDVPWQIVGRPADLKVKRKTHVVDHRTEKHTIRD